VIHNNCPRSALSSGNTDILLRNLTIFNVVFTLLFYIHLKKNFNLVVSACDIYISDIISWDLRPQTYTL
jgi:hypothetical protein